MVFAPQCTASRFKTFAPVAGCQRFPCGSQSPAFKASATDCSVGLAAGENGKGAIDHTLRQ
jgi:hypothetical protein